MLVSAHDFCTFYCRDCFSCMSGFSMGKGGTFPSLFNLLGYVSMKFSKQVVYCIRVWWYHKPEN